MTALGMILSGLGLTLVWCGIRDEDPRAVFMSVFTGGSVPQGKAGAQKNAPPPDAPPVPNASSPTGQGGGLSPIYGAGGGGGGGGGGTGGW